jgi:GAF domain-containing protein
MSVKFRHKSFPFAFYRCVRISEEPNAGDFLLAMLPQMTARLLGQNTLAGGLRTILNDVIALHGAEFGNIQLAIDDDTLALIEHRGFDEPSLRSLRRVARDGGAASARAFAARKPVVIPDLSKDRALAPYHQLANTMGVRAMQSTPFIAAGGKCVGVVSTHFANVHTPTEIEMETLQQYGFVAADFIISKTQGADLAAVADACFRRLMADVAALALPQRE